MKKNFKCAIAAAVAGMLLLAGCGGTGGKTTLKLGTGGTTGTYYAYGGVLANVVNEKVDGASITVQSTGASKANIFLIDDKEADLAIVQNDVMDYAYNGTDLFQEDGAVQTFSSVAGLYAEVCQVIAAEGIESIADLKGKRVSVGDAGSGVEFNARQILEAYGVSFEDITVQNLGFGDSADALKDGKIDAFFCTAGAPTTAVVELSSARTIQLLGIDDEHAAKLIESYPFYTQYAIPGGSYKGVDSDVMTVAVKATLIVSAETSEDVVYNLTKAIFENKDAITQGHAKGAELDTKYAVEGISVPFHPGAVKYYKEAGVLS